MKRVKKSAPHPQAEVIACKDHPDRRAIARTKPESGGWVYVCPECYLKYNPSGIKPKEKRAVKTAAIALLALYLLAQSGRGCVPHDITHGPRPNQCDTGDGNRSPGDLGPNGDGWQSA